jgi:hypothetical protein
MSHSLTYPRFGTLHQRMSSPVSAVGARPFWCEVIATRWSNAMKSHVVAATLLSGPGVRRTWLVGGSDNVESQFYA